MREHKVIAVEKRTKTSVLAHHVISTEINIQFGETKIPFATESLKQRSIREALEIEVRPNKSNKQDDSAELHTAWKHVLDSLTHGQIAT